MTFFKENASGLTLRNLDDPNTGFRPGQLGALHSVMAHFSVHTEPAIVSLPTGYGKTAVIMALPFLLECNRILVVEPTDALRRQTASHFKELSTLRKLNVISSDTPNPNIVAQTGVPSDEEWSAMEKHDVVVSLPQSLSPATSTETDPTLFDLVIFDEAHHVPAASWLAFMTHYEHANFVFLTATPFRRDKKTLPGRLAYWYPVLKASEEKAFAKVSFVAARPTNPNDDQDIDLSIARAAAETLSRDSERGCDHRIFARARSIDAAKELVHTYEQCGLRVKAITSHIVRRTQLSIENALMNGELDGIVCVHMFGEGYDFPKLKIAALHAPHQSLVPTLQFIGRFARTTDEKTGDATLIAPLTRVREATAKLFQEGIDIAKLIDEAAQEEIQETEREREVSEKLVVREQAVSDYDVVSPLSIELYAHAVIYECFEPPQFDEFKEAIANRLRVVKRWVSDDGLITLILTVDESPPNWARSSFLANVRHDAFIMAYNEASKYMYVGATRKTERLYLDLVTQSASQGWRKLSYAETRRALAGLDDLRFFNVGVRNTALNTQVESYRIHTGPRAEMTLGAGDSRNFMQGHFFGSGANEGETETIGASSTSKIWSNQRLSVAQYLDWCSLLNARLASDTAIAASQLDIIQHARPLREIPETIIAGAWDKAAYRHAPRVRYRQGEQYWSYVQITDLEMNNFRVATDQQSMSFVVETDTISFPFVHSPRQGAMFTQDPAHGDLELITGYDEWRPFAEWLSAKPPVFYAADLSSFQGINYVKAPSLAAAQVTGADLRTMEWDGCAIEIEFQEYKANGQNTVHQHLESWLLKNDQLQYLVYDHRSGEAADYIAVSLRPDAELSIALFHCKGAGGNPSGGRVGDVYEVAGQMVKSIVYCDPALLINHIQRRMDSERQKVPSYFVKGDFDGLADALTRTPRHQTHFEIVGVQPGIAKSQVDMHLSDLMAFALDYLRRGGAAQASWLVHA